MTAMIRVYWKSAGGHVHMRVFLRQTLAAYAFIGDLHVRVEEFPALRESWPEAEFVKEKDAAP